jgi:hypothetical protein
MLRTDSIFRDFEGMVAEERGAVHINRALILAGPCPCDSCSLAQRCAAGLACFDFVYYVANGRVRHGRRIPGTNLYRRMFGVEEVPALSALELEKTP